MFYCNLGISKNDRSVWTQQHTSRTQRDTKYKFLLYVSIYVSMAEEKRKVNSWVPVSLWEKVENLGYDSPTKAVCDALELLVNGHTTDTTGHTTDTTGHTMDTTGHITDTTGHITDTEIQALKIEIEKLKNELHNSPDPLEFSLICARFEELERHNETLKTELEKAAQDKEDLKSIHNNYMLQMQTLITQKTIEAPGAKKPWWRFW